jgi:putative iron-dependent peroxidase
MLENMFVGNPPDNYDRILDFSTAVTGSLFFVPSATFLDNIGDDAPEPTEAAAPQTDGTATASHTRDASLNIGSLKGETNE